MTTNRKLLALIAARFPAIYDVIPRGPQFVNPAQSYAEQRGLNPQPLPPRAIGELVANEIVRLSWTAQQLGVELSPIADWDGDICPPPRKPPKLHGPFPPVPPDPGPDWILDYHLGLASTLAAVEGRVADSATVKDALEQSTAALTKSLG
jgi:hypothetical protein